MLIYAYTKRKQFKFYKYLVDKLANYIARYFNKISLLFFKLITLILSAFHFLIYIPRSLVLVFVEVCSILFSWFFIIILKIINYKSSVEIFLYKQAGVVYILGNLIWHGLFMLSVFCFLYVYACFAGPFILPFLYSFLHSVSPITGGLIAFYWGPLIFLAIVSDYGGKFIMKLNI